jgi:hypothetical protein
MEHVQHALKRGDCPDLRDMSDMFLHWLAGDGLAVFPAGELRASWDAHRAHVEGEDGLFSVVRERAPRLESEIGSLDREHAALAAAIEGVLEAEDEDARRQRVAPLIELIDQHCAHAVSVVYDAFDQEIGGG